MAVTLVGLAKGGFTGVGMVATPMLALIMPPLHGGGDDAADPAAAGRHFGLGLSQALGPWNLKVLIPGGLRGVGTAGFLAALRARLCRAALVGLIGVSFVLWRWFGPKSGDSGIRRAPPAARSWGARPASPRHRPMPAPPPWQVHMMPQHLPKPTFAGTATMFFAPPTL